MTTPTLQARAQALLYPSKERPAPAAGPPVADPSAPMSRAGAGERMYGDSLHEQAITSWRTRHEARYRNDPEALEKGRETSAKLKTLFKHAGVRAEDAQAFLASLNAQNGGAA